MAQNSPIRHFAVAVMGADRPGIVAAVTGCLLELGCNLEDVATSILRGHFALTMVVSAGEGADLESVHRSLSPVSAYQGLMVAVWEVEAASTDSTATHLLTVYGRDRTGILHALASHLGQRGVNIADMSCRLHDGIDPVYVVSIELELPGNLSAEILGSELTDLARSLGCDSSLRALERTEL